MPKGFEVDLGDEGAPAPATAAKVFGLKKEETAMGEPEVQVQTVNNMTMDSPKELWDVMGHISLAFHVSSHKEVIDKVEQCVAIWGELREAYAAELNAANMVSDAQLSLMKRLAKELDEELPEGYEDMSKEEASTLITTLIGKRGGRSQSAPVRGRGEETPRRSSGGRSSSREEGITEPQLKYIKQLCRRTRTDVPDDIEDFTKQQASDFIKELNG